MLNLDMKFWIYHFSGWQPFDCWHLFFSHNPLLLEWWKWDTLYNCATRSNQQYQNRRRFIGSWSRGFIGYYGIWVICSTCRFPCSSTLWKTTSDFLIVFNVYVMLFFILFIYSELTHKYVIMYIHAYFIAKNQNYSVH